MYRKRLRPKYSDEELGRIYQTPHDSNNWEDHKVRVRQTIALGKEARMPKSNGVIADLSCGNGMIARELAAHFNGSIILGDYAHNGEYAFHGPLEETVDKIPFAVELFVCSETIEHLDNPEMVLRKIRHKAGQLLLSTPISEGLRRPSDNPEHYWGWDTDAVQVLLNDAGWVAKMRTDLTFYRHDFPYNYQIWLCQ